MKVKWQPVKSERKFIEIDEELYEKRLDELAELISTRSILIMNMEDGRRFKVDSLKNLTTVIHTEFLQRKQRN